MTVINLHKTLADEFVEAWCAMEGGDFSRRTIDKAVAMLLGPRRMAALKRAACLVALLQHAKADVVRTVFVDPPRGVRIMELVRNAESERVAVDGDDLILKLDGGNVFAMNAGGVRLQVCVLRMLAEALGFDFFRDLVFDIEQVGNDEARIEQAVLKASKAFDGYRLGRIGSHQSHRKCQAVRRYLQERFEGGRFGAQDVTWREVFDFWEGHADRADLNVKQYRSTHDLFVTFLNGLEEALKVDGDGAQENHEFGGVSAYDDWLALKVERQAIDFLKGGQYDRVESVTDISPAAERLMPSEIRARCFGRVETELKSVRDEADFEAALGHAQLPSAIVDGLTDDLSKFVSACWASLHVLLANRNTAAVFVASSLAKAPLVTEELVSEWQAEGLDAEDQLARVIELLAVSDDEPYVDLRRRAEACWKETNRRGFRPQDLRDEEIVGLLADVSMRLGTAARHALACCNRASAAAETLPSHDGDLARFVTNWRRLYRYEQIQQEQP